jgi:hypothetical protein
MIKPPSQAPFAPVPQAWFSFSLFAFRFYLSAFLLPFRPPTPTPPHSSFFILHFSFFIFHCAFPSSPLFIPHNSSFIIYHLSLNFQLASKHFMRYA